MDLHIRILGQMLIEQLLAQQRRLIGSRTMGIEAHVDDVGIAFLCCFLECLGKVHHIQMGSGGQFLAGIQDLVHLIRGEIHPVGVFLSLDTYRQIEYPDSSPGFVLRGQSLAESVSSKIFSIRFFFLAFFLVLFRGINPGSLPKFSS